MEGVGTLFTLWKVKAHQTKERVDALQGDELAAFNANNAADLAAKQGTAICSAEMERGKVTIHAMIRKVLLYFAQFVPQVAEQHAARRRAGEMGLPNVLEDGIHASRQRNA